MPVVSRDVPPNLPPEAKKRLVDKINNAMEEAYPFGEKLIFFREYDLGNVAVNGGLQSENPRVIEAIKNMAIA